MLAIFKTGGKQYSVKAGQILKVEKLLGNKGDSISFSDVLAVTDNTTHTIGDPLIKGAIVQAKILDQIRALRKITTVRNVTPPEYMTQSNAQHSIIILKFVTRGDALQDLKQIKNDILTQTKDRSGLRIPGIKSFKIKIDTLKRK